MAGLRIRALREIVFGRFKGETIEGFDHPFVVVHGNNETGKSTITEFITWMVGGPSGNAKNALRFGDPDQKIGGRLLGELDGDALEVFAKFGVKKSGSPNDVRTGIISGNDVTAATIVDRLRKLSSEDYAFIYRFIGPSLHDTDGDDVFASVLSRFAIGAAASDINPREVAKNIADEVNKLTKAITAIEKDIRQANVSLKESKNRPQKLSEHEKRIEILDQELEESSMELQAIARDLSFMESAIDAFDANEELIAARAGIVTTSQVPSEWTEAVANAAQIRQTIAAIQTMVEKSRKASESALKDAQAVGLDPSELATRTFTNVERSRVRQVGNAYGQATKNRIDAQQIINSGASDIQTKASAVQNAASQLKIDVTQAEGLVALQGKLKDVNAAAITWRNADDAARTKATIAKKEKVEADSATEHVRLLEEQEPAGNIDSKKSLSPLVIACVVLAGAGAFLNPIISGVFALAAAVLLLRPSRSSVQGAISNESPVLIEAKTKAGLLAQQANFFASQAEQLRLDALRCREDFENLLTPFGVSVPAVDFALNTHQLLVNACVAVTAHAEAKESLRIATENLDAIVSDETKAAKEFSDTCSQFGISYSGAMDVLDEWLDAYQLAVNSCREEVLTKTSLKDEHRKLFGLLGNVPASVSQYPLERIIEEIDSHEEINRVFRLAVEREKSAQVAANAAGGEKDGVKQILDQVQTKPEIEAMKAAVLLKQGSLNDDRAIKIEERGVLKNRCEEIENIEEINEFNLVVSQLEDERDDLVAKREAQSLAASTLLEVIDKFEKENQAPLVKRANELLNAVVPGYGDLIYSHSGSSPIIERDGAGGRLNSSKLSTGSRALVYLALRLAFVEADHQQRGIALPVLCDDPLVHIDDDRAPEVMQFLAQASQNRQVILFTCHEDTRDLAVQAGAHVVSMPAAK